jgi:asparagine synthase (glutamine-hydrolysing)
MCGIAGIVGKNATDHEDALRRMVDAMRHRGPDGEGYYRSPSGTCLLGHRRLAILDLSDAAAQPMVSPDAQYAFAYNGECYNFRPIRAELAGEGEAFASSGDTEVLFRLLRKRGRACLSGLNAMFAFGFWDEAQKTLLLARDRFGQKPLYYTHRGSLLLFASELRALLASGLVERRINPSAIRGYLAYGAVQGPETIVDGVRLLPAAHYLDYQAQGRESSGRYWTPPTDKQPLAPEMLRDRFCEAVERHLISDAPIGLFLSGGIDSSAIAAAAAKARPDNPPVSLAVIFPDDPSHSEQDHARRMARHAGTEHHEIPLTGSELLARLPSAIAAMDQPTVDSINTEVVSYAARCAGLKVALSGLGGDELFGGYPSFRDIPRLLPWLNALQPLMGKIVEGLSFSTPFSRRIAKLVDLLSCPDNPMAVYLARRRLFTSRQVQSLLPSIRGNGWSAGLPEEALHEMLRLMEQRDLPDAIGLLEMCAYMENMLLRDSDVMGMAHSLEIRVPFLDAEFAGAALRLDSGARVPSRIPKARLVRALGDWLPRENVERPKQGFTFPFVHWMQKELRGEMEGGLEALAARCPLIAPGIARTLWHRFLARPDSVGWSRPWALYILSNYIMRNELSL